MRFKRFLESEDNEKTEEQKRQEQIVLLRLELKDAKTDEQAQAIQAKINKLLNQEEEELPKETHDSIDSKK